MDELERKIHQEFEEAKWRLYEREMETLNRYGVWGAIGMVVGLILIYIAVSIDPASGATGCAIGVFTATLLFWGIVAIYAFLTWLGRPK